MYSSLIVRYVCKAFIRSGYKACAYTYDEADKENQRNGGLVQKHKRLDGQTANSHRWDAPMTGH